MTDPREAETLQAEGLKALQSGDAQRARDFFGRAVALAPKVAGVHLNLALADLAAEDPAAALESLDAALALEPRLLAALLLKGDALEKLGEANAAARAYAAALQVAPPYERAPPNLKPLLRRAAEVNTRFLNGLEETVRDVLAGMKGRADAESLLRFDQALEITLGKRPIYRQQPHMFFLPGLRTLEFYPRKDFPWLDAFEAATEAITAEFLAVQDRDEGFSPYIDYPADQPLDQWRTLNKNPDWSAFHIWKNGARVADHAERAPVTAALLETAPQPRVAERSPNAMFSVLKPKTRIPPHTGVSNTRLVVHVPLVVPEGCGFRCGNTTVAWEPGRAFVFDDTIEHEAWNDSDRPRAVLIFDIWHPDMTEADHELYAAFMAATDAYWGEVRMQDI